MQNSRLKKSIRTLALRQSAISRRPPTDEQIEKMNKIFECIDKEQEKEKPDYADKRSARVPEAQT